MNRNKAQTLEPAYETGMNDMLAYGYIFMEDESAFTFSQLMYLPFKRLIDFYASFLGLILCLPIFIAVSILIKLDSQGPVFFKQKRAGLNGRAFYIYKFRSMVTDAEKMKESLFYLNENDGPFFKIKNDPRITRVGKFIRKYSIDELPQLINVFLGHMSLVGPRPALFSEIQQYSQAELQNLNLTPGLTCYWQISGRSDSSGSRTDLDAKYKNEFNLIIDLIILLKTPISVLKGKGAC